jgi:hypothetical protein
LENRAHKTQIDQVEPRYTTTRAGTNYRAGHSNPSNISSEVWLIQTSSVNGVTLTAQLPQKIGQIRLGVSMEQSMTREFSCAVRALIVALALIGALPPGAFAAGTKNNIDRVIRGEGIPAAVPPMG